MVGDVPAPRVESGLDESLGGGAGGSVGGNLGGKADGLLRLQRAGEAVPAFVVVPPEASGDAVRALLTRFAASDRVAVRSSASDEDGATAKAGHYLTELDVAIDEVVEAVARVRASGDEPMHVVVQQMVPATLSGVVFSADPSGILDLVVISAGHGTGAVVAADRPSSTTTVSTVDGRRWTTAEPGAAAVDDDLLERLVALALRVQAARGVPVDIEWAQDETGELWVLQARAITTLPSGSTVTLDNSNIVENYPGLVLPLTASFVPETYREVFTALARRVCPDRAVLEACRPVLEHMVHVSSGRLYYRLESWYAVMALMPFSRRYTRVWRRSLGVDEGGDSVPAARLSLRQRLGLVWRLTRALNHTPDEVRALGARVAEVQQWAEPAIAAATGVDDLERIYRGIVDALVSHWDVTLLNDVRAFVFPALLTRVTGGRASELISGVTALESLRPVVELAELAATAPPEVTAIDSPSSAAAWWAGEGAEGDDAYRRRVQSHVDRYGDRWLEELKLESPTLRTDAWLLVQALQTPLPVRTPDVPPAPRGRLARALARRSTEAIALRESSRLDRARVHALVRALAHRAGELLHAQGRLEAPDDVFWLTLDELFDPPADLRDRIGGRRDDHADWLQLPPFRRLTHVGEPFDLHAPGAVAGHRRVRGDLTGHGVSGSVASGRVVVVDDPRLATDIDGAVLVTASTDPGWVFLLTRCAAVVAERGSMLSHTAIVARELGVPVVVGVSDATGLLDDGERVEVDGRRGVVRRLDARAETPHEGVHDADHQGRTFTGR